MPHTTLTPVRAYAHCVNSRCPGNAQAEVDAIHELMTYSYEETGGDGMFAHPERTIPRLRFADPEQSTCPTCGANRELSETARLQLDDSGYDRMALLDIEPFDPKKQIDVRSEPVTDEERERLEAEKAALQEQLQAQAERLAKLEGFMLGQQSQAPEQPEPLAHEAPEEDE